MSLHELAWVLTGHAKSALISAEDIEELKDDKIDSIVTQEFTDKDTAVDYALDDDEILAEAFRVLKPGGYALVECSSHGVDLVGLKWRRHGFELRDEIVFLSDYFSEPVLLFRKPFEGTVVENVLFYGTGGLNIDAWRIKSNDKLKEVKVEHAAGGKRLGWDRPWKNSPEGLARRAAAANRAVEKANTLGRYSTNVILVHDMDCQNFDDKSNIDDWICHHECVVPMMGENARFFRQIESIGMLPFLMQLITPPNGVILNPFTAHDNEATIATELLPFRYVGLKEEDYLEGHYCKYHQARQSNAA